MELSLVIPAYNEEKYIGRCIERALAAAPNAFKEIIVVDNGSTDRTGTVAARYPGVRVVREERKGTGFARDRGFRETTSEIIAFIDADTYLRPDWHTKISDFFARNPRIVCVSGPYWYYDLPAPLAVTQLVAWYLALPLSWFASTLVIGGNFAIRRSTLEAMRGFDTRIEFHGDDVDIGRRASVFGKVHISPRLILDSSGRRFAASGFFRMWFRYIWNHCVGLTKNPRYTRGYEETR